MLKVEVKIVCRTWTWASCAKLSKRARAETARKNVGYDHNWLAVGGGRNEWLSG